MKRYKVILVVFCLLIAFPLAAQQKWISLFNGKDLKGWDIKIAKSKLNENYKNTFRVENGILKVSYDQYEKFNGEYGHLYYKKPYSYYLLRVEYRFVGNQLKGGESWNVRNSGVMIHSQSAKSVGVDQTFPVSLEIQFLGGLNKGSRATGNLCTPGTTVEYNGKTFLDHIIESSSPTYNADQWVTVDAIVLGDSIVKHFVNGKEVLAYTHPKIGGGFVSKDHTWTDGKFSNADYWIKKEGTALQSGYIALQAESHPIEFRKVELLDLTKVPNWKKLNLSSLFPKPTPAISKRIVVENFDDYTSDKQLAKAWYFPPHGGQTIQTLESSIKGGGSHSLRFEYHTTASADKFYSPICRVAKWDVSGTNAFQFWFKPDGSGLETTVQFNIANKEGKNIHDLWEYKFFPAKGDTTATLITVPFDALVHNTKYKDSPDVSPVFKPEALIEVAWYIGGKKDPSSHGVYYFDELVAVYIE
ncbi:MAG: family 16 glycoside hydrolase [Spirosomataceae bacterium]